MTGKKLVVFDVDGTLLNSYSFFCALIAEYSKEKSLPLPCIRTIETGYAEPLNHDFKWGMPREEQGAHLEALWEIARMREGQEGYMPPLFDGVQDTLAALQRAGHTLAVVTAKSRVPLQRVFDHHGITGHFSGFRDMDHVREGRGALKPAPDLLHCVMRELGAGPGDTVMIGDTSMDIKMGLAAGAATIGVCWGNHDRDMLAGAGAQHLAETGFSDIIHLVDKIFSRVKT